MFLTRLQEQTLIKQFNHIYMNQLVQIASVNYVLRPFEGNINPGDPKAIKIYPQATKGIDKESYKLDISVSNSKEVIDQFLSLADKYVWGCLSFMLNTVTDANSIFKVVYQIQIADMRVQAFGYFGLQGIVNVNQFLPNSLTVLSLKNLAGGNVIEIKNYLIGCAKILYPIQLRDQLQSDK